MNPIVVSMSGLQLYKRCPKAFDLSYIRNYEPKDVKKAVEDGRSFHEHMAALVTGAYDVRKLAEQGDEMALVAWKYTDAYPVPDPEDILSVEEPTYVKLLASSTIYDEYGQMFEAPELWLRCTFDLVHKRGKFIVGKDYKTFERAPTLHVDLDFQGRIYSAVLAHRYDTWDVEFEYAYVRRVVPGTKNSKGFWKTDECYINVPLLCGKDELTELWRETLCVARNLRRDIVAEQKWTRSDLKVGPHACESCFFKHGCIAEIQNGTLTEQTAAMFYDIRAPIVLPEGLE